jgi:hypothetical protein
LPAFGSVEFFDEVGGGLKPWQDASLILANTPDRCLRLPLLVAPRITAPPPAQILAGLFPVDPLTNVRRALIELDAAGLAGSQETHRFPVNQFDLV